MTTFLANQRVTVTEQTNLLFGWSGTVTERLLHGHAWVRMDADIPAGMRHWPVGDARVNDVLLLPDEVKAA